MVQIAITKEIEDALSEYNEQYLTEKRIQISRNTICHSDLFYVTQKLHNGKYSLVNLIKKSKIVIFDEEATKKQTEVFFS